MKKYRLFRSLLALALAAGLTLPTALAAQSAPPEATPAVVTPKAPVESQLLSDMHIEAAAAILVDADTGTVLFDQNAHEQRYPASITKVMTAMLAIEAVDRGELSLNDVITVGSEVNREVGDGSSTQNIRRGNRSGWRTSSTAPSPPPPMRPAMFWPKRSPAVWTTLWP